MYLSNQGQSLREELRPSPDGVDLLDASAASHDHVCQPTGVVTPFGDSSF